MNGVMVRVDPGGSWHACPARTSSGLAGRNRVLWFGRSILRSAAGLAVLAVLVLLAVFATALAGGLDPIAAAGETGRRASSMARAVLAPSGAVLLALAVLGVAFARIFQQR